jgi:hypothetical protein
MISLNYKADNSLSPRKGGADKHVHKSQRDKWKSLLSSKGNEVYLTRDEESWITHVVIIGVTQKELLKRSLACMNPPRGVKEKWFDV